MAYVTATQWKSSQLMSDKNYEINFYRDKDFKTVSMHSHDFYELYFFMRGDAGYIVENGHYKLRPGDTLLISPSNLHQLDISDSTDTYERIVLWLNPRYIKKLSSSRTDLAECFKTCSDSSSWLIRDADISELVGNHLLQLYAASSSSDFGDDVACELHIKTILLTLCRYLRHVKPDTEISHRNHGVVARALEYISDNLDKELSLDAIAEALYISKFYLSRLFKRDTGTTPHQYILKKRLILSKQLIESDLPINEVYGSCGFCDYSHFFRAFKQEYGITPKQYYHLIKQS